MTRDAAKVTAALLMFLLAMVLNVAISLFLFAFSPDLALIFGEPVAILLPTVIAVRLLGLDARKTLRLRLPSWTDLLLAVPLAFSLAVVNDQLSNLASQVFPVDEELLENMARLLRAETGYDWLVRILGIGVGAAVSEEILFRGFIQRELEQGLGRPLGRGLGRAFAIGFTSLMFAIIHLIPHGIPAYLLAGIAMGITAVATGSILVPIVVHFTHNMSAVLLLNLADLETLAQPFWVPAEILIPALLTFGLTVGYYLHKAFAVAPESEPVAPTIRLTPFAGDRHTSLAELDALPPEKRRLGWLVVGCAVASGTAVILGLFFLSLFYSFPAEGKVELIRYLKKESLSALSPRASDRAPELAEAFDRLADVNAVAAVSLSSLARLAWAFSKANADGTITELEMESILEELDSIAGSGRRRLRRL